MTAKPRASNANNSQEFGNGRDNSCALADVVINRSLVPTLRIFRTCMSDTREGTGLPVKLVNGIY